MMFSIEGTKCPREGESLMTASGRNLIRDEVKRKEVVSTVWSNDH